MPTIWGVAVQAGKGINVKPYLKNNQSKMGKGWVKW
jgi:hypothetical protein